MVGETPGLQCDAAAEVWFTPIILKTPFWQDSNASTHSRPPQHLHLGLAFPKGPLWTRDSCKLSIILAGAWAHLQRFVFGESRVQKEPRAGASADPEWELDPRGEEAGESSKLRIPWKSSDYVPLSGIRKVGEERWRGKAIPKPSSWGSMPCLELTEIPG